MPLTIHGLTPLLQVFDMPTSIQFYCDVLGFSIVETSSPGGGYSWAMLCLGPATLMLNTAYDDHERPEKPDPGRIAAHQDAALYFGCDSADEVYAHLCAKEWPAHKPYTAFYGMRQVYTKDPDGFIICFQNPAVE